MRKWDKEEHRVAALKAAAYDDLQRDRERANVLLQASLSVPGHLGKRWTQGLCDEVEFLRARLTELEIRLGQYCLKAHK